MASRPIGLVTRSRKGTWFPGATGRSVAAVWRRQQIDGSTSGSCTRPAQGQRNVCPSVATDGSSATTRSPRRQQGVGQGAKRRRSPVGLGVVQAKRGDGAAVTARSSAGSGRLLLLGLAASSAPASPIPSLLFGLWRCAGGWGLGELQLVAGRQFLWGAAVNFFGVQEIQWERKRLLLA